MLNDILWPAHIQWQPPTDQTLYRTRPFIEFWVVSIEHLRRVCHVDRGRLLLWTPCPVPLGLAYVLPILFRTCRYFTWLCSSNIPRYFLDFASDKETTFLDLNIKVIGSDIHTSVYDKRDDFGFSIVNFPCLSDGVPRLPSYGIYISQLVRFARCCTSVMEISQAS